MGSLFWSLRELASLPSKVKTNRIFHLPMRIITIIAAAIIRSNTHRLNFINQDIKISLVGNINRSQVLLESHSDLLQRLNLLIIYTKSFVSKRQQLFLRVKMVLNLNITISKAKTNTISQGRILWNMMESDL